MVKERDFYSTREASQRLSVSLRTVQVWVESGRLPAWKTDGGHRRIPRSAVDSMVKAQELASAARERPPTVVLIDDDRYMLDLCKRILKSQLSELHVETATNGFEGLLIIGKLRPDLILLDLQMPGLDGFRLLHALSNAPDYADIAIVVMTGLEDPEITARGGLSDTVSVLRKPYGVASLAEVISKLLRGMGRLT